MENLKKFEDFDSLDELKINTVRFLSVDGVEKAKSGHPGMPMGDAPMAYVLWSRFLRHNPENPKWPNRDRFILSAGHGSMLLYSLLHLTGYNMPLDELKNFRQWGSHTPGHPEYDIERGIETTTGPLGQGFANSVGMAMAERYLADRYNKPGFALFDHYVYSIASDGDMMEGVSNEAASIAGHLGLGKVICLYSDNKISIEGSTDIAFTEDVGKRFEAMNWHVQRVGGLDLTGIAGAIEAAREEATRPSLIMVRTNIGYGSPAKQDTADAHGEPLGAAEVKAAKENLGWPLAPTFFIPADSLASFRKAIDTGKALEAEWNGLLESYSKEYPELGAEVKAIVSGERSGKWVEDIPVYTEKDGPVATRASSGKVLNAIAKKTPFLLGGSADLGPSTKTTLTDMGNFLRDSVGRNLHFGVREHAMGSILNGMALSGTLVPYGATFLVFSDYMRPPIRLAALMGLQTVYVFTHDSIGLGEDGPTHQPVEQLASLRAIPKLKVIRPADANETAEAWKAALLNTGGPVALVLTRQNLPVLDRTNCAPASGLTRGGYVLADCPDGAPEVILIATGSEVHIALESFAELTKNGIPARVVSMPCCEIFDAQDKEYRDSVLPPGVAVRVTVEAGSTMGWHKYAGSEGAVIGIDRFGASAPYKTIYERFGITAEEVTKRATGLLNVKKDTLS